MLRCRAIQGKIGRLFLGIHVVSRHQSQAETACAPRSILHNVFFIALGASAVTEVIHDQLLVSESGLKSKPPETFPTLIFRTDPLSVIVGWLHYFEASLNNWNLVRHERRHTTL
jgi:hypothetical protein